MQSGQSRARTFSPVLLPHVVGQVRHAKGRKGKHKCWKQSLVILKRITVAVSNEPSASKLTSGVSSKALRVIRLRFCCMPPRAPCTQNRCGYGAGGSRRYSISHLRFHLPCSCGRASNVACKETHLEGNKITDECAAVLAEAAPVFSLARLIVCWSRRRMLRSYSIA